MRVLLKQVALIDPYSRHDPVQQTDILLQDGIITKIGTNLNDPNAKRYELKGLYAMPGVIDCHTHIGYGSARDTETETKSAVSGGVTSVITYYRKAENYLKAVPAFIDSINCQAFCNVGIHLGLSTYEQANQLTTYVNDFHIPSFKYFTNYVGAAGEKAGVEIVSDANLLELMGRIRELGGTICIHAENQDIVEKSVARVRAKNEDSLWGWFEARPPICEAEALLRVGYFAAKTGCTLYAVHVTCKESLEVIGMLKRQYPQANIIMETCPHYLTYTYRAKWGNVGKVNPPLRRQSDVDALWEAIEDGRISVVASDHVARPLDKKTGSIFTISAGFPGCATLLPILLEEGYHKRAITLSRIAQLVSAFPAEVFGMSMRGRILPGWVADLTIIDLHKKAKVPVEFSNADYNLYQGLETRGWPVYTFINGVECRELLYREEPLTPAGRYVPRISRKS